MYKRIPATSFDTFSDIYYEMINFMQECGFSIIATGATQLFTLSDKIKDVYILQDPNSSHKLCLVLHTKGDKFSSALYKDKIYEIADSGGRIALFIFDEYYNDKYIHEQGNIAKRDGRDDIAVGLGFFDNHDNNNQRRDVCDLICIYNHMSLIFIYVPTNCYVYSHIYDNEKSCGGHMLYYGNFTKYHFGYDKNVVCAFSTMCKSEAGVARNIRDKEFDANIDPPEDPESIVVWTNMFTTSNVLDTNIYGLLYCDPEATYTVGENHWFSWNNLRYNDFLELANTGRATPPLSSSFDICNEGNKLKVVNYVNLYINTLVREKSMFGNTLNNVSVLLPLIIYGMHEPKVLYNWSAIGENKLINMIDMSHLSSGDIYIDTSIEKDLHRYFVFPCFLDYMDKKQSSEHLHMFLGLAIEIEAKEDLLHSQSEDYLTINLNDRFRNFDRIEVVYGDNKEIEWRYDDLEAIYDTEGIFNLTKDDDERCLVYGLKNTDGKSTEYRFTCSESCKIISITGYRE